MALLNGIFNTTFNPDQLNKRSFAATLLRLYPDGSFPIYAMTSQTKKATAVSSTHGYFTKTMTFWNCTLAALTEDDDTTLTVPSTVGLVVGSMLYNRTTREVMRVTSVDSSTVVTVERSVGDVAAADCAIGHKLIEIGNSHAEGSNRPSAKRWSTVYVSNYTSIVRNAWAVTGTAKASLVEQGYGNVTEDRTDCALMHATDIEKSVIWSQAVMDTSGSLPFHTTKGIDSSIREYAPGNVNAAGSTTTYAQLIALLEPLFTYSADPANAKDRIAFTDATGMKVFNEIGRAMGTINQNMGAKKTTFGMTYSEMFFHKGTLRVIEHSLMTALGLQGTMYVMDMPSLRMAYLGDRDVINEEYGIGMKQVESGVDAVGGSMLSEFAVELTNPQACGIITGLTAGA